MNDRPVVFKVWSNIQSLKTVEEKGLMRVFRPDKTVPQNPIVDIK